MTTWGFYVDWEDNYDYADLIDDITADIKSADWNLGLSEPYQNVAPAAKLTLTVRNTDGKYNPENASSPLYGYLVPGRRVRITCDYGSDTTAWNFVVKGIDPDWKPTAAYTGKTQARIVCEDLSGWLERDTSPTALFQNKRADEIIKSILLQAPQVPVIPGVWVLGKTGFSELGSTTTESSGTQTGGFANIGTNSTPAIVWQAQGFQCTAGILTQITFNLTTNMGSPIGDLGWQIRNDDGTGKPGNTVLASGTITPTPSATNAITVSAGPTLAAATSYHLVLFAVTVQATNTLFRWVAAAAGTYANGQRCSSTDGGTTWTATLVDCEFTVTTVAGGTVLAADSDFMTLDTGISTFEIYGDNSQTRRVDNAASAVEERSSKRIIAEIVAAERGRFFFNREGKGEFWNRYHTSLITNVSGTVSSTGTHKPVNVNYMTDRKYFTNNVEIQPHQRATGEEITLFTLASPISIQTGDEYKMDAPYTNANNQPTGAVNVKRGEWIGSDQISLYLSPKGDKAQVKFKNNDTTTQTLSSFTLVGQPVSGQTKLTAYAEDAASIAAYGKTPTLKINLPALDNYELAVSAAKYEVARRSNPAPMVTAVSFLVDPNEDTFPLEWGIGTRILVDLPELGHSREYIIIGESYRIEAGFFSLQATFNLEPADTGSLWVLGVSRLGEGTRLGF